MPEENLPNPFDDVAPPPSLKARTVATLISSGALAPGDRRLSRLTRSAGLLAAALIAGFLIGRVDRAGASEAPRYLLLLYEDSAYHDDRPIGEIVAEYARWADSLRQNGLLEAGEKLADAPVQLTSGGGGSPALRGASPTGFFIIRAADVNAARAIAASAPHIRQGGRIGIHLIEKTPPR